MKSSALPEFWEHLEKLPPQAQKIARKNFKLWQKAARPEISWLQENQS